jgi:hypothetical protein
MREGSKGKHRIEILAAMPDAGAQRTVKIRLVPTSDAGGGVGRDIGAVENAERRRQRRTAGERRAVVLGVGVAGSAIGRDEEIFAPLHGRIIGRRGRCAGRQNQAEAERYCFGIFSR